MRFNDSSNVCYQSKNFYDSEAKDFLEDFGITEIVSPQKRFLPSGVAVKGCYGFTAKVGSLENVFPVLSEKQQINAHYLLEFDSKRTKAIEQRLAIAKKKKEWVGIGPLMTVKAVQVVIDVDAPIESVCRDVSNLLNRWQKRRLTTLESKRVQKAYGRNKCGTAEILRHLDDILKAYRLKTEKKLGLKKIAEVMKIPSSEKVDDAVGEAVKGKHRGPQWKVKNYINEAKKKIDGEYRRIEL